MPHVLQLGPTSGLRHIQRFLGGARHGRSAVKDRPADVVPQTLVVKHEFADLSGNWSRWTQICAYGTAFVARVLLSLDASGFPASNEKHEVQEMGDWAAVGQKRIALPRSSARILMVLTASGPVGPVPPA
jgi:hypothetical protein